MHWSGGPTPDKYLVDGGFTHRAVVTQLEAGGTQVYAPLYQEKKQLEQDKNPYALRPGDSAKTGDTINQMSEPRGLIGWCAAALTT